MVCAAYSVNALLYVFLKTQGVSAKDIRQTHVKQELVRTRWTPSVDCDPPLTILWDVSQLQERVKAFVKKIKDAEELAKGPKLVLDKDASKRFVHNALSSDQVYADAVKAKEQNETSKVVEDNDKEQGKGKQGKRQAVGNAKAVGKKSKRQRK
jgi:exosome complex protein LRP1